MTRCYNPQINPNFLLGCHPLTLKDHFQDLDRQGIDVDTPILASNDQNDQRSGKKVKTVFQRLAPKRFLGKTHLIKFLYQKQQRQCKHNTLSNYCTAISTFLHFVQTLGRTQIDQLVPEDLEAYIEYEQDLGKKPATLQLRLVGFYSFVRYLVDQQVLPPDRFARKIRIKLPDTLPKAMDPVDIKRLLTVIKDVQDRAMILVMLRTGMRIGELLNLKMDDVRLYEQKILIWEGEKNCTGRSVCLSNDASTALSRWFYCRDPKKVHVFYARGRNTMGYTTAREMMNKYIDKAGLAAKRYTLHSLRHTFATDLLNAGMRLECLQQLLGHSTLEMTLRYARLTDKTRENEYFKAMAIIEGEVTNGADSFNCPFPSSPEAPELFATHDQKLS